MRIVNSIEHLPRQSRDGGFPPSSNPFAVDTFAKEFWDHYVSEGRNSKELAIPEAGPYRASNSTTRCDRALYYNLSGTARTNELTIADHWTFYLGQIVHEQIQPVINAMFPGAIEQQIDLNPVGIPGSAHADLVAEIDGHQTLIEITTVNGFKFKKMAARFNGEPEGPAYGKVMQALLAAKAAGIPRVVVMVLSLEKLSPSMASSYADTEAGRFMAEWHYTVDEMEEQIDAEVRRVRQVMRLADDEIAPARELHDPEYPTGAVVVDPGGRPRAPWTVRNEDDQVIDSGDYWGCNYCAWQEQCKQDGE